MCAWRLFDCYIEAIMTIYDWMKRVFQYGFDLTCYVVVLNEGPWELVFISQNVESKS